MSCITGVSIGGGLALLAGVVKFGFWHKKVQKIHALEKIKMDREEAIRKRTERNIKRREAQERRRLRKLKTPSTTSSNFDGKVGNRPCRPTGQLPPVYPALAKGKNLKSPPAYLQQLPQKIPWGGGSAGDLRDAVALPLTYPSMGMGGDGLPALPPIATRVKRLPPIATKRPANAEAWPFWPTSTSTSTSSSPSAAEACASAGSHRAKRKIPEERSPI
jgi:hypothetical protein